MNRPIALNLVRGILGALDRTPRGIDRIDFGYRDYLLQHWPNDCVGVMPTPMGMRYFSREIMARGHKRLAALWREQPGAEEDVAFSRLKAALQNPDLGITPGSRRRRKFNVRGYWRLTRLLMGNGIQFGKPVSALPPETVYLDVGHYGLGEPRYMRWLDHRLDIRPVFMLHDAIPLEFPEMVADDTVRAHQKVMAMSARYARAIIVPTKAAGSAVGLELGRRGRDDISIHPVPLPIDRAFREPLALFSKLTERPYFMICGAIETRKNHRVLLEAWSRLVARLGTNAPRLIVAGAPGHQSAQILREIEARTDLRGFLYVSTGLFTPTLARLMAGARAILMPSFAEGFGLPPIEALSLGIPAVLSDIAAHRDAAGPFGIYLDPNDVSAWDRQIEAMSRDSEGYLRWKRHVALFEPYDWPRYMGEISEILMGLD